jgi:hypothetical protein
MDSELHHDHAGSFTLERELLKAGQPRLQACGVRKQQPGIAIYTLAWHHMS